MAYVPFYDAWVDAVYDSDGTVLTPSPTPFTATAATHWDDAIGDAMPQTTKGDLVGYSGSGTSRLPVGASGAALVADPAQALGVRWSTDSYVPASQRGPLGGSQVSGFAASLTLNAASANAFRVTATGSLTVNPPTNPSAAQMLMLAVVASGANRTVTLDGAIKLTTGVTRAFTIQSGERGFFGLRYEFDITSWVCLSQTQTIGG